MLFTVVFDQKGNHRAHPFSKIPVDWTVSFSDLKFGWKWSEKQVLHQGSTWNHTSSWGYPEECGPGGGRQNSGVMDSLWISLPSIALPALVTMYCFLGEHLRARPSVWPVHVETAPHSEPRAGHTTQTHSSGAQQSLVARWVQEECLTPWSIDISP